jgi:hypothetical protein
MPIGVTPSGVGERAEQLFVLHADPIPRELPPRCPNLTSAEPAPISPVTGRIARDTLAPQRAVLNLHLERSARRRRLVPRTPASANFAST